MTRTLCGGSKKELISHSVRDLDWVFCNSPLPTLAELIRTITAQSHTHWTNHLVHKCTVPCWIQMITGEGGNKFVFFLIICFWFSLCFFATNLSIDLLTFVRLSENKINGFKLSEANVDRVNSLCSWRRSILFKEY